MKFTRLFAAILALTVLGGAAFAQGWTERPFAPPVGSRWLITSDTKSVEHRGAGEQRDQRIVMKAEVTIDEKLPDGYRVTYVNRMIDISGNSTAAKLIGDAYSAVTNIPMHARTDAAGHPLEVENLAEVQAAMRAVVAEIVSRFSSNPKAAEFVRQLMGALLNVEGKEAATTYLDELPQLAVGQNTGLKPGETRRTTETIASPLGSGTFKSTLVTRLDTFDDKTGKARIVRKREYDQESLREVVMGLARQLAKVGDDKTITPEVLEMMKKVTFTMDGETRYDIEGGMTRAIDERETTVASVMGTTFRKEQKKTVAITRLN
jgi:hypothetical protein